MPTPSYSPINLAWNNNKPLTLIAKVDAVLNPTDTLLWEHEFVAALNPDQGSGASPLNWNGIDSGCTYGAQQLSDGIWRFTALSGIDVDHPIEIIDQYAGELLGTLSANGNSVEVTIQPDIYLYVDLLQNAELSVAAIEMKHIAYWDTNGYLPTIATTGNQLSAHWNYTPRQGVLTARAKAYDGNNFLVATSGDLTLTIAGASSGGS
jgi:hypothetical protein